MKTQKDMDFDPSVFEVDEADVFALDDDNLNASNSFDMTWVRSLDFVVLLKSLRGSVFFNKLKQCSIKSCKIIKADIDNTFR